MNPIARRLLSKTIDVGEPLIVSSLLWVMIKSFTDLSDHLYLETWFFIFYALNTFVFVGVFGNATFGDKIAGLRFVAPRFLRARLIARELTIIIFVVLGIQEPVQFTGAILLLLPVSPRNITTSPLVADFAFGVKLEVVSKEAVS